MGEKRVVLAGGMLREGYLVKIFLICSLSSLTLCTKFNYKIKAAGKTFDIESESAENKLDAPEVKMNQELTVDDLKAELEKLKLLESHLVKKLYNLKRMKRS